MATNRKTPDRELSEPAFHAKYGYYAGWDEAREMVHQAMAASKQSLDGPWPILFELWKSMDTAARQEKYEAYARRTEL